MRRITLTVVAILLAVPAVAAAKVGIEYTQDPATVGPGEKMALNIMILKEPKNPAGPRAQMTPAVGAHPIVTFRSESGRVVRVRGHAANQDGVSRASVRLPDAGPWTASMRVPGVSVAEGGGHMEPFKLGTMDATSDAAVDEVVRPPAHAPVQSHDEGSATWWILLGALAALGGLTFTAIRTGIPARLRTRLGGGGA
jgi:hypothetical protein